MICDGDCGQSACWCDPKPVAPGRRAATPEEINNILSAKGSAWDAIQASVADGLAYSVAGHVVFLGCFAKPAECLEGCSLSTGEYNPECSVHGGMPPVVLS